MNFKQIHIGSVIKQRVTECEMNSIRICNFFKCTEKDIRKIYYSESLDTNILIGWSKLLNYDFFRIYTQHLILFAPLQLNMEHHAKTKTSLPTFRKNIYTKQIIDFILERIESGKMNKSEVIMVYKIPKTTLYKWIYKYNTDLE